MGSINLSIVITTYKENEHIKRILTEISYLKESNISYEIILLDASDFQKEDAEKLLKNKSKFLTFISSPGLSRTKSLNKIFNLAVGELIVRLDARSSIPDDYIDKIYTLYKSSDAEVVGGSMKPIGTSKSQKVVANLMSHPLCFGGSRSRDLNHTGYVDSVYLGAFSNSFLKKNKLYFDGIHPDISEDSDLNYRINKCGGKIYQDSSIFINHYPRENLKDFFKLCFNYGVGRGIFVIKHRNFMFKRQLVPPIAFLLSKISNKYTIVAFIYFINVALYTIFETSEPPPDFNPFELDNVGDFIDYNRFIISVVWQKIITLISMLSILIFTFGYRRLIND